MSSPRQIAANRRNAQNNTGPSTPEGRAAVRFNALQHGLAAQEAVLPTEDQQAFAALAASFFDDRQPVGPVETLLVRQMAVAAWQLQRAHRVETGAFEARLAQVSQDKLDGSEARRLAYAMREDFVGLNPFGNLARYQTKIERSFYRALRELQLLQCNGSQFSPL